MKKYLVLIVCLCLCIITLSMPAYAIGSFGVNIDDYMYTTDDNPFYAKNLWGQCTWYCWGRAVEKCGECLKWGAASNVYGNANDWYENAQGYYSVGTTPRVDSIAVWKDDLYGHVAFVEAIDGDIMYLSESNLKYVQPYIEGYINLSTGAYTNTSGNVTFANGSSTWYGRGNPYGYIYLPNNIPSTFELDVNGMLDGAESGWVKDYATFDLYVNGSRVANDINDYCAQVNAGSSYEIKDIKVADGKAFDGYSGYTRSGYASGSRTGTVSGNTDVRLQLHTVNAAGYTQAHAPSSVSTYNGHSYYFYNSPVTWWDAKTISEYLGRHLVTITSTGENSFVKGMMGASSIWIGATDRNSEGTFKWVTGESFSYSDWGEGQPDNWATPVEGEENYAHIWGDTGKWNDNAGCELFPFVCEIDRAYTISYNANEGSGAPAAQVKAVGQAIKLSTVRPTRDGYSFLGWATSSSATTARFQPGDTYSTDANLTLYAVWKRDGNTIHYIANGGENPPADQFKASGETVTLSTDIPTRRGYTFLGWGMSANATAPSYQPGDSYSANADLTLYALWRITNPPTLRGKDASMLVGDTRDLADFVELSHDGVLSYTLTATATGVVSLDGQRVTATAVGSGALTVSVAEYPAASCAVNIRVVDLSQMLRLPAALTEIGSGAFENSGIAAVTLPEGCASIGNRAFAENAGLVYIYIPASVSQIAQNAFVNSPNTVIYCYAGSMAAIFAENNNIRCVLLDSGWVAADQLPPGARVTDEKWTYQRTSTETTTSTASSMPGWTQSAYEWQPAGSGTHTYANYPGGFDTGHSLYGKYNKAALSSSTSGNTKREVGASAVNSYIFWHWTFVDYVEEDNRNVVISDVMEYGAPAGSVSRDFIYFDAFETGDSLNGNPGMTKNGLQCFNDEGIYSTYNTSYDIADYASWWWYRTTVYKQSYTDYQKLFTYTRTVTSEESSDVAVTEGGEISNVQHWVKYVL